MEQWMPPGSADDLDQVPDGRTRWDIAMTEFFAAAVNRAQSVLPAGSHAQIVDAVHPSSTLTWSPAPIFWNGFPKVLLSKFPTVHQALVAAEKLIPFNLDGRSIKMRPQDEYLEWHTTTVQGKIKAVDFTCEGPEYWQALAHGYPDGVTPPAGAPQAAGNLDLVTALYRKFVDPAVQKSDLLDAAGHYDPWNQWNTAKGAMHLTHISNSLQAEVFLAGDATVLREKSGVVLIDADQLIRCAQYGVPERSSDPTIGSAVNGLARSGALVSLLNPVGLYIDSLDTTGWTKPDGSPVGDYWTIQRGTPDFILRARYEVPEHEGFTVSDIKIGGQPIAYAGQIAQKITMRLTGISADKNNHNTPPIACAAAASHALAVASTVPERVGSTRVPG